MWRCPTHSLDVHSRLGGSGSRRSKIHDLCATAGQVYDLHFSNSAVHVIVQYSTLGRSARCIMPPGIFYCLYLNVAIY